MQRLGRAGALAPGDPHRLVPAAAEPARQQEAGASQDGAGGERMQPGLGVEADLLHEALVVAALRQLTGGGVEVAAVARPARRAAGGRAGNDRFFHEPVGQARGDVAKRRHHPSAAADEHVAHRVLGRVQDRARHRVGRVDQRNVLRLGGQVVLGVGDERGVDLRRLDQGDGDWNALVLQLHAQRLSEALDRVLRRAIDPLQRHRAL